MINCSDELLIQQLLRNVGGSYFAVGVKSSADFVQELFDGHISEIMVFDPTLKQSEINDIQEYLAKKYRITIT